MTHKTVTMRRRNSDCEIPLGMPADQFELSLLRRTHQCQRKRPASLVHIEGRVSTRIPCRDETEKRTPHKIEDERRPGVIHSPNASHDTRDMVPRVFDGELGSNNTKRENNTEESID